MSTRQTGNRNENACIAALTKHGYWCFPSRGSRGIDIIALAPPGTMLPHFAIECGAESKRLRPAFAKHAQARLFPGMVLMVVRAVTRKNRRCLWWYRDPDTRFDSLEQALENR